MNKKIFFTVLFLSFFLWINFSVSKESFKEIQNISAIKAKIQKLSKTTKTIQGIFFQEKFLSILLEKIKSKGSFYFKAKNMLRWEYTKPFSYLIIFRNNKIIIKDEGKVSKFDANSSKTFQKINNLIISSINGSIINENKDFSTKFFRSHVRFKLILSPKSKEFKKYFKRIDIFFDKRLLYVDKIQMIEPDEDYTSITFTNRKINSRISDDKFYTN